MPKLFLQLLDALSGQASVDPSLLSLLPRSYKRIGHIAIFNLHESLLPYKELIGQTTLTLLPPSIRTVARFVRPIDGTTRKPSIEWLAGDTNFETVHLEHHTKFCINPQELMLSAGNHFERKRIIDFISPLASPDFVVLDMFSCIGNLSLPLLNLVPDLRIIFLELNPVAVKYLRKSLVVNKIDSVRYTILEGDNHLTCPSNVADFVIMGYFGIDVDQLTNALNALNTSKQEGWIQIHDSCFINQESTVFEKFQHIILKHPMWSLNSFEKHIIKSIGPSFQHIVFDCHLIRLTTS